ncbi:hypothetical protein DSO57_1038972 [Entomophthora muscae]|uniref:Uncharacterized protein n=1 Tax=Entomophthora muscae TaxID=34485 RepID=A0ACC2UJ69_9FUNG|nr:hypothetical protein DSO57_1038972 [Entomophthora muscae]
MEEKSHVIEVGRLHDDTPIEYPDVAHLIKPNANIFTPLRLQKHGIYRLTSLRFKYFVAKMSVLNFFMSVIEFILALKINRSKYGAGDIYGKARIALTIFDILMQLLFSVDTYARSYEIGFKEYYRDFWHCTDAFVVLLIMLFEGISLLENNEVFNQIMLVMVIFRVWNASRINYMIGKRLLNTESERCQQLIQTSSHLQGIYDIQVIANLQLQACINRHEKKILSAKKEVADIENSALEICRDSWLKLVPQTFSINIGSSCRSSPKAANKHYTINRRDSIYQHKRVR